MRLLTVISIILKNIELSFRDLFGLPLRPYKLLLELTNICNSKCKTCYIWKNGEEGRQEISSTDLGPVFKEYGKNLLWVALSGGEATLYQEFDNLVALLKLHCPRLRIVTFTTNGLKPAKILEMAQKLKSLNCDLFVTISLDGDEKTHDFIRGIKGNYALARQSMSLLKENRIWAHYGLTVSSLNKEFIQSGLENSMSETRAFSFEHSGGIYRKEAVASDLSESVKRVIALYKIRQLGEIVEYIYLVLAQKFFSDKSAGLPVPCEAVASSLHIRPNGDITPCMFLPSMGNIKETRLGEMLSTPLALQMRERARTGNCQKCWMNCYAPHSMMRHPLLSLKKFFLA